MLEAFNTRYKTTGITYRGENETKATTKLGSLVDINFLPIIGLGGEIDWGVQPYDAGTNGGIVGTVTYDTTRNELDPADAVDRGLPAGHPGRAGHAVRPQAVHRHDRRRHGQQCRQGHEIVPLKVDGHRPNPGTHGRQPRRATGARSSRAREVQESYTSEKWAAAARLHRRAVQRPAADRPAGAARVRATREPDVRRGAHDGRRHRPERHDRPATRRRPSTATTASPPRRSTCGPKTDPVHNPDGLDLYARAARDGQEQDLRPAGLHRLGRHPRRTRSDGKPMYQVTKEEDVNVFDGDSYLPQENFPPTTPAMANDPAGPPDNDAAAALAAAVAAGRHHLGLRRAAAHGATSRTRPSSPAAAAPSRATTGRSCGDKLVTVRAGQATAPNFNLFTDVPIPTHFWGLTLNDLGLTLRQAQRQLRRGPGPALRAGRPLRLGRPAGRHRRTPTSTASTRRWSRRRDTYNCPVPAGPCPNMYRFVGQRPGPAGRAEPGLQPAVPHHRDELPGAGRACTRSPTRRRPRSPRPRWRRTPRWPTRPSATSAPAARSCSPSTGRTCARTRPVTPGP